MTCQFTALIPLRGGSKGILNKNIKPIAGKPLCAWVIESAVNSPSIDKVYISTESQKIKDVVLEINYQFQDNEQLKDKLNIINRPDVLANDTASTEAVMLHCMAEIDFDNLLTIQATSPLLTSDELEHAIHQFRRDELDSMVTAVKFKRFLWDKEANAINYDPTQRPRRQDFEGCLMENGAFYITKKSILEKYQCRLGGKTGVFIMPEETGIEIDGPVDWMIVEAILKMAINEKII